MSTADYLSQMRTTYRRMSKEARYRPAAPSDGLGNITGPLDMAREADLYARMWRRDEDAQDYPIGCPDYHHRPALVFTIEAARLICGLDGPGRATAVRLLRMAADELEAT